ncbi:MAG: hypothetical protein GY783_01350 [Gammaproteobacteria bacterium]|nr:hypothetical protein [Gammaproteobacteria bacterium]MCP4742857.1 hypothetical protein [Actinomycetales bacterium]MCP4894752.1 hypothetical protein [Actinomycetales bacterium]
MSTRATIAVRRDDQTYDAVYLHFDGYPQYTGELLMKHHQSPEAAEALIAGGDVRCLETDGTVDRFADGKPAETQTNHDELLRFARRCGANYIYVFDGRTWNCTKL